MENNSMEEYNKEFKEVKRLGSSKYMISKDKELFVKISDNKKALKEEYGALKKMNKENSIEGLDFIEPVALEGNKLITKYVDGAKTLIEILDPDLFYKFGEKLKEFHEASYTHGHLQFNDVMHKNNRFIITDLGHLNKKEPIYDLVNAKKGLEMFKIKKPWKHSKCNKCFESFLKGYGNIDKRKFEKQYKKRLRKTIERFRERGMMGKIKVLMIIMANKVGFID